MFIDFVQLIEWNGICPLTFPSRQGERSAEYLTVAQNVVYDPTARSQEANQGASE